MITTSSNSVITGGSVSATVTVRVTVDAAFPAGFLALLVPHLKDRNKRRAAVIGAVVAVVTVPLLPAGFPVLLAALGAVVATRIERQE